MAGLHNYPMHDYTVSAFSWHKGDVNALANTLNALTNQCAVSYPASLATLL